MTATLSHIAVIAGAAVLLAGFGALVIGSLLIHATGVAGGIGRPIGIIAALVGATLGVGLHPHHAPAAAQVSQAMEASPYGRVLHRHYPAEYARLQSATSTPAPIAPAPPPPSSASSWASIWPTSSNSMTPRPQRSSASAGSGK